MALKKFCGTVEAGTEWQDYIGEITMGLRFCVTRAHSLTPYRVIFGRDPMLPSTILRREFNLDKALATEDISTSEEYVLELVAHMHDICQTVVRKLALYDARAKKYADQQHAD